jgi:peptidoglycan/xylan/chitin deacetylase (PgdA/CDA1 family)
LAQLAGSVPPNPEHLRFWSEWVAERLRLARLFPHVTSEVFPLQANEALGFERADKHFALTFDDGPSPVGGSSEETVRTLRDLDLKATFFVLGEHLHGRAGAEALYSGFCVGSHGTQHFPHVELEPAQASVERTRAELEAMLPHARLDLFRPPYGQRSVKVAAWLSDQHFRVELWNIDSQDWRAHATPEQVAGRVLALMLVERRGTILFHDVHPVAAKALPLLVHRIGGAVLWDDCDS